jgi:hypothetical protein
VPVSNKKQMTVKQLIQLLKSFPPDAKVQSAAVYMRKLGEDLQVEIGLSRDDVAHGGCGR